MLVDQSRQYSHACTKEMQSLQCRQAVPNKGLEPKNLLHSFAAATSMVQRRPPQTAVVVGASKCLLHVWKGQLTGGQDEAAAVRSYASEEIRAEAGRDEASMEGPPEAPAHASFWTAGPSPLMRRRQF